MRTRFVSGLASIFVLASTLACSPADPDAGTASEGLPSEAPYIRGTITAINAGRIRVEENPAESSGSAKAMLHLTSDTRILDSAGAEASSSDLRVGQEVSAWVVGPVMESYPVQATAGTIVIEAAAP